MDREKNILCQEVDDYTAECMGEGYCFSISIKTEYEGGKIEMEGTEWWVHPNGTFSGETSIQCSNEPLQEIIRFSGTFEKSKYKEYVKQMQNCKEDWIKELVYDDTLSYDTNLSMWSKEELLKTNI